MKKNFLRLFYPLAGVAIILIAWHFYVVLLRVHIVVLPGPWQVAASMATHTKILLGENFLRKSIPKRYLVEYNTI